MKILYIAFLYLFLLFYIAQLYHFHYHPPNIWPWWQHHTIYANNDMDMSTRTYFFCKLRIILKRNGLEKKIEDHELKIGEIRKCNLLFIWIKFSYKISCNLRLQSYLIFFIRGEFWQIHYWITSYSYILHTCKISKILKINSYIIKKLFKLQIFVI